jgi:hypothetical protein
MYMYPPTLPPLQRLSLSQQASKQWHSTEHQNNVMFCLANWLLKHFHKNLDHQAHLSLIYKTTYSLYCTYY